MTRAHHRPSRFFAVMAASLILTGQAAEAGISDGAKTVDDLTIYLGVVPAAVVRGHAPQHAEAKMHGGVPPPSLHEIHLVAAVFSKNTGLRVEKVRVFARIQGTRGKPWTIPLTPMPINGALSFGGYANLGLNDDATISIDVIRPSASPRARMTTARFEYSHD